MTVAESTGAARADDADDALALELITRAIRDSDQAAWSRLVDTYRGLVLARVRRTATLVHAETDAYWVNRAFERFWSAVTADRLAQFPNSRAVQKYLSLCAHSVVMDELRRRQRARCERLPEDSDQVPAGDASQDLAWDKVMAGEVWHAVADELPDEGERLVAYLSLVRDMKPSQIAQRHPDKFTSVSEVYAIKRGIVDRLRRSARVRQYLD
jgi:DNA-directed RNA polymerase specialized sigma24 family protein